MRRSRENGKPLAWLAAGAWLLATTLPVSAADGSDQWEYDAMIYLWGAGMDITTQTGADIDISFSDILDDLDMAFMGTFAARKDKWSLLADAVYLDISQDNAGNDTIPILAGEVTITRTVDVDLEMEALLTTFGAGYNVIDNERVALDLVGGARYFWVDVDLKLDTSHKGVILQTSRQVKVSDSKSVWDGIVGVRGEIKLNDNWSLPYYADVGTGESESTWQAMAGVGYNFKWGDVLLVYRYLDYEFDKDFLLKEVTVSGPALGARFRF